MTIVTLATAFATTRDRLKLLGQAAVADSAATFEYVVPQPDIYPRCDFVIMHVSRQLIATKQQRYNVALRMIIHVAQFQQGFEGEAQVDAAWVILPTALEYFERHSGLKVNATDAGIPYFDPITSAINDTSIQINGNLIDIVLSWTLSFLTEFPRNC